MCFKTLPVVFDEAGKAHLREGAADPYVYSASTETADRQARMEALLARNGHIKEISIDPVTRVAGGVPPPPPRGGIVRTLGQAAEFLYAHPLHLFLLAGPDYSEPVVKATNPELWTAAETAPTLHGAVHGFRTVAEIMTALTPLSGALYLEAFEVTRRAREMCVLVWGKYPHPQTIVPGGISTTITTQTLNEYQIRLFGLPHHSKRMALIWDHISEFLYAANPGFHRIGSRPKSFIDLGIWEHHEAYDATYANADKWGEARWATPGAMVAGELRTTDLQRINLGLEEFVEHSYYESWANGTPAFPTDPLGNPLSPHHPWHKQTLPAPTGRSWKEKDTWAAAPRWGGEVLEAGAYRGVWLPAD